VNIFKGIWKPFKKMRHQRTKTLSMRIPEDLKETMVNLSEEFDLSLSDVVIFLCRKSLQQIDKAWPKKNSPEVNRLN
jgi:hypothetical protein